MPNIHVQCSCYVVVHVDDDDAMKKYFLIPIRTLMSVRASMCVCIVCYSHISLHFLFFPLRNDHVIVLQVCDYDQEQAKEK